MYFTESGALQTCRMTCGENENLCKIQSDWIVEDLRILSAKNEIVGSGRFCKELIYHKNPCNINSLISHFSFGRGSSATPGYMERGKKDLQSTRWDDDARGDCISSENVKFWVRLNLYRHVFNSWLMMRFIMNIIFIVFIIIAIIVTQRDFM